MIAREAANTLALQRLGMYEEDQLTANKVTRKNTSRGGKTVTWLRSSLSVLRFAGWRRW